MFYSKLAILVEAKNRKHNVPIVSLPAQELFCQLQDALGNVVSVLKGVQASYKVLSWSFSRESINNLPVWQPYVHEG